MLSKGVVVVTLRSGLKLSKVNSLGTAVDKDRFKVVVETSSTTHAQVMIDSCASSLQGVRCSVDKSVN